LDAFRYRRQVRPGGRSRALSLAFNVMHFDSRANWIFVTNVLLFAVFACCWALRTGNVWGVMGWHGSWNWLLAVGFQLRVTALDAHLPALLVKFRPVGPDYLTAESKARKAASSAPWSLLAESRIISSARDYSQRPNQTIQPRD